MTRILKIMNSLFIAFVLFHSCKKSGGLSEREALIQYDWYPYQTHIDYNDTIFVTTTDINGQSHTHSTTYNFDTTYILDQCFQQSTFSFQSNGRYIIKNMCGIGQLIIDTTWTTNDNQLIYLLFIRDSTADALLNKIIPYGTFTGNPALDLELISPVLTKINSSAFDVQQFVSYNFFERYYANNNQVDSVTRILNNRVISFKAR